MGDEKMARFASILLASVGVVLIVVAGAAMVRRQDALAGGMAVLGLGAVIVAGLMPRLTGNVEMGLSGFKLEVAQLSQAGQAAGYRQDEIVAAIDELRSGLSAGAREMPAPGPHVLIPATSGDEVPGLDQANVAVAHREKYLRTGDPGELESAILKAAQAVELAPGSSPWRSSMLGLIGELMLEKFGRTGEISELDRAVSQLQEALAITATESPAYAQILAQLARAVQARYEASGDWADQEQVLKLLQHLEEVRRRPS